MQNIFGFSEEKAIEKENEIIHICTEACFLMKQAYGLYGDLGIDVIVDQHNNVWIIEINKLHQHIVAKYQKEDLEMYNNVVTKPFEYAKSLAGFNSFNNL